MLLKGAVSEREINKQPHHNSLKAAIAEALPSINTHYLIEDATGYRSQIQSIIEAEDSFIQYEKWAVKEKKLGMGHYLKFQIRVEYYALTIHIRIRKVTIRDFQILKLTKHFATTNC